jgi:type IV secretory pathway VirB6-like protein
MYMSIVFFVDFFAFHRHKFLRDMAKNKNPHAVALGKLGGSKGGKLRAAKLTAEQRSEIARKAVLARWAKAKKSREAQEKQTQ